MTTMSTPEDSLRVEAAMVLTLADQRCWEDLIARSAPDSLRTYREAVMQCFDRICRPPLPLIDWNPGDGEALPWEDDDPFESRWCPDEESRDWPVWGFRGIETVEQLRALSAQDMVRRWFEQQDEEIGESTLPPVARRVIGVTVHEDRWGFALYVWHGGRPPEDDEAAVAVARFELVDGCWRLLLGAQPHLDDWGLPGADVPFVR